MKKEFIIEKLTEIFEEEFEITADLIQPSANLHETLELDSLDYVDLVVLIEKYFKVKLRGEDFKEIQTFNHLYEDIYKRTLQIIDK